MNGLTALATVLCTSALLAAGAASSRVEAIVQQSVERANADWAAAPEYSFTERDVITKGGTRSVNTYEVTMIEGSPYKRLIASGGRPLSDRQQSAEQRKLRQEIARRRHETPIERSKRIADYQQGRRQDHMLMLEMMRAFDFKLTGEETVNGRRCYVLVATPRPGYEPRSRETKVLKGMRGKMWIDQREMQWVKVHAEVFRPVTFGLFVAHVEPGTEFELEQMPVGDNTWLPGHFMTHVKAEILYFWSRRSADEESYSNYHRNGPVTAQAGR